MARRVPGGGVPPVEREKPEYPTVGDVVDARWSTEPRAAGKQRTNEASTRVERGSLSQLRYGAGKEWYRARVTAVHPGKTSSRDPSFDLLYDDGDRERAVKRKLIRVGGAQ